MNKKGQMWKYIVGGVLALVILIVIIIIFSKGTGVAYDDLKDKLDGAKDCDKDGAINLFDKCPCDDSVQDTWPEDLKVTKECRLTCTDEDVKKCNE